MDAITRETLLSYGERQWDNTAIRVHRGEYAVAVSDEGWGGTYLVGFYSTSPYISTWESFDRAHTSDMLQEIRGWLGVDEGWPIR